MPRNEKRDDGRYQTRVYLGRDEQSKKRYRFVYAKSPAAQAEAEDAPPAEPD